MAKSAMLSVGDQFAIISIRLAWPLAPPRLEKSELLFNESSLAATQGIRFVEVERVVVVALQFEKVLVIENQIRAFVIG